MQEKQMSKSSKEKTKESSRNYKYLSVNLHRAVKIQIYKSIDLIKFTGLWEKRQGMLRLGCNRRANTKRQIITHSHIHMANLE